MEAFDMQRPLYGCCTAAQNGEDAQVFIKCGMLRNARQLQIRLRRETLLGFQES